MIRSGSEAPKICICDVNNDNVLDVLVYGNAYRTELRQDLYLSDGNGGYLELGDVTWNKRESQHAFTFEATYGDSKQVSIMAPEWNIAETIAISDDYLFNALISIGIYDKSENITELGESQKMNNLQGKNIWIEKDESENAYLYTMRH